MAKLIPVFADFETYWSPTHSLTSMNPIVYATHPETELISLSYKFGNDAPHVIFGEQAIKDWCRQVNWSDKLLIAHNNSGFDAMLFRWRCGVRPAMWGCTLAMARPIHALGVGGSLAKLVEYYGIGRKDSSALHDTKGKHLCDFTPAQLVAMKDYNKTDTEQCAALFAKLLPLTSKNEMKQIDMTIRMLVEPKLRIDTELLEHTLSEEQKRKHLDLFRLASAMGHIALTEEDAAEYVRTQLASAPKFAELLTQWGVEVPMKPSPSDPTKQIPALAKTDAGLLELQEHPNSLVAAAAAARLSVKSTLLESRTTSFLEVSRATGGRMPVALTYYGGHTGRWGGCLVADTEVIVYNVYTAAGVTKRIVDVTLDDLVWDGEAFVAHEGVVFSGYSETINWDGIEGTEDHVVYTDTEEIGLREALQRQLPIKACASPTQDDLDAARVYARYYKKFDSM